MLPAANRREKAVGLESLQRDIMMGVFIPTGFASFVLDGIRKRSYQVMHKSL
jgi:hypothetical protein